MRKLNQIFLHFIILVIMLFVCVWLFNHVYPWIGIGAAILTFYLTMWKLIQFINKKNKENEK